jgi:hypothetical protein
MATNLSMVEARSLLAELVRPSRQLVASIKAHVMASGVLSKFEGRQEASRFFKFEDAKRWSLL